MSWESPNIVPPHDPEALPENLPVQKSESAEALVSKEIEQWVTERIEPAISEIEQQEEEYIRMAEGRSEGFEKDFGQLKEKLDALTRKLKKTAPLLLSMAFMVGLEDTNSVPSKQSFTKKDYAATELSEKGITQAQTMAYRPGVSEFLYRAIPPYYYRNAWQVVKALPDTLDFDDKANIHHTFSGKTEEIEETVDRSDSPEREDAWRLYLGMPQKNHTFGVSEYRPTPSEDAYYYKINDWIQKFDPSIGGREDASIEEKIKSIVHELMIENSTIQESVSQEISSLVAISPVKNQSVITLDVYAPDALHKGVGDVRFGVMGKFTLSLGSDERGKYISYYDKWDLGGSLEGEKGLVGKPFEIYDRIYYDPETFEPIG